MTTKMKGLFKGLRYISQIFEDEKEEEMQIGFPTDVKHVAHIGSDGPSAETPSWMKEFKSPAQSAPLDIGPREQPDVKWISEDSRRGTKAANSPGRDTPVEVPRSSRRHHSAESDSPRKKDSSTKSRQSKKNQPKDSSEGILRSNRQLQESGQGSNPTSGNPPDIPRKTRRKKSKESVNGGGSGSSRLRSRATASNGTHASTTHASTLPADNESGGPNQNVHDEGDKGRRVTRKD